MQNFGCLERHTAVNLVKVNQEKLLALIVINNFMKIQKIVFIQNKKEQFSFICGFGLKNLI